MRLSLNSRGARLDETESQLGLFSVATLDAPSLSQ